MKQSYRHIFLILGTLFTVFGLLLFSFQVPFQEMDYVAFGVFVVGAYMLFKMLQSAPKIKVNEVKIVENLEELEVKKNRFKKEEISINDKYKKTNSLT